MSDYLLQVRVQNKPLTLAMRAAGYKSATAFSKACGISAMTISRYLNCQLSPFTQTGKWKIAVLQMSKRLSVLPDDLFPEQYQNHLLKVREIEISLSLENMVDIGMLQPCDPPDVLIEKQEERLAIAQTMADTLNERQRSVLNDRLGLSGDNPMTLEEVAQKMGVTRERIRQIERQSLRRLGRALRKEFPDKYAAYWRVSDKRREVMQAKMERARQFEGVEMHESGRPLEVTRIIRDKPTKPLPPTLSSDAIVELLMQYAVKP